jgi:diacylglycerol O-acyltransferase
MVDGIAGVGLLTVLLDAEPHVSPAEPEPWEPGPEPPGAMKVLDAWAGLVGDVLDGAGKVPRALVHPGATLGVLAGTFQGVGRLASRLRSTPLLSIDGDIGPHRCWNHSSASLGDVKAIRSVFGGTVNDVVLAAVSGGYRELLASRGDDPDEAVVRSLVPVSTRNDDGRGVPDNRVTLLLYELPVGVADPVERLALVHDQMVALKGSHMAEAGEVITTLGNLAPPMLVAPLSRAAIRTMHLIPQRSINTVTTNVPGPQFPLYCLGREMLEYLPFVPISYGVRVSTAILSYNGRLFFGMTGDYASAPDVGVLASATVAEIEELRQRALAGRV